MQAVINNSINVAEANKKQIAKREVFIDFFRAICLLFVMIDHRSLLTISIGAFVLPGFFIASGYTFKENPGDFKTFLIKKIKRLLIPFWIAVAITGCVEMGRATLVGYSNYTVIVPAAITGVYGSFLNIPQIGSFGEFLLKAVSYKPQIPGFLDLNLPTGCHLWFLPALFSADLIMYFIFKFRKGTWLFDISAIVVLLLLAGIETIPNMIQLPYGLGRGFFAAAFMLMGFRMKKSELFTPKKLNSQLLLFVLAIVPTIFSIVYKYEAKGFVSSNYGEPIILGTFITYICGLSFSYIVMYIMYWLAKLPNNKFASLLSYAGRNSMDVYLWHLLVYFLGDLFMIYVFKASITPHKFYVELFLNNYVLYRWLIVFITYGVLLGYCYFKNLIKTKIKMHKQQLAQN